MRVRYDGPRFRDRKPKWFEGERQAVRSLYAFAKRHGYTVDHIVPLNNKYVCGLHCYANLQVLTGQRNLQKSNNWWPGQWGPQNALRLPAWEDPIQTELNI